MEGFILLCALSLAMFVGSYFAGSLPLAVSFSESRLRLVTILGAGLLVGTALAVIIPEGVQSIYTAQSQQLNVPHLHNTKSVDHIHDHKDETAHKHQQPHLPMDTKETASEVKLPETEKHVGQVGKLPPALNVQLAPKRKKRDDASAAEHEHEKPQTSGDVADEPSPKHNHDQHGSDVHGVVGIALVAGFVLMLLVDQLAQSRAISGDVETASSVQPRYKITATIGLVVHAAADGVALGAASGSAHADVQFIVFFAIMLHKAPASFGLVTFLLHEGLDKSRIRKHLLIFALAAPVAAILTFVFITQGGPESLTSLHTTGVLLLFSAGTFLYVATVHVLPEVASVGHSHNPGSSSGGLKLNELVALVVGAILPTVLTVGHSH